jgi:cytochrome c biogenesis protein CcdA
MIEELFAAFIIGISFSNTFVCMLLGFGATSIERRETGKYFILGRFIGIIILGLIIASIGVVFLGYIDHLMVLFGVLTITFGLIIFYQIYQKNRSKKDPSEINVCAECNHTSQTYKKNSTHSWSCSSCESTQCEMGNDKHVCKTIPKSMLGVKLTKHYSFMLGIFRGATPCLKIFIIAPLLLIVHFWLAVLMIIIFAAASSVYTIIGFISASVLTNFRKYEKYVQVAGACMLIGIGAFTIINRIISTSCAVGI